MVEHDVRLLEVHMRREVEMRDAAEYRLARSLVGRDRMPGWRSRFFGRLVVRPVGGSTGGNGSDVPRLRQAAHLASSPERDLVRGVHDLTGFGRRRFLPVPVELGRDGR